jgi:hypothetical protein
MSVREALNETGERLADRTKQQPALKDWVVLTFRWGRHACGEDVVKPLQALFSGPVDAEPLELEFLTPAQVARIDALLATVGDYGEVHLIVQHGELRYINRVESHRAWGDDDPRRRR